MTRTLSYICLLTLCLVLGVTTTRGQITVSVPSQVSAGENFRLSYTINTQDVEDFRAGNIPEGLEVIAGPYTSQQMSYQINNGHTSSYSSVTFTYTLYADKNGTYTIPAAHAKINGKSVSSRTAKVMVSGTAQRKGGTPRTQDDRNSEPQVRATGSHISGSDLFIRVSASKRRVHEQEPVLLTYKLYTLVELTQLEGKMPDLTGFHTQEIPTPQQKNFQVENINGRAYRTVTWSQYLMYPQMTGELEIPSITFKGIVVQQNRSVDPFEAFLNGGSGYVEVKCNIEAPGLKIQVDPLPTRPANFSGGVGKFNISAQLSKKEVKTGDPVTLRVVVGGTGNLKLIKQPMVEFPKDFDKYDPKVTDKTKLTSSGVSGNMVYDFLAVPRSPGKYKIPPVEFVYYDTQANAYRTAKTQGFELTVEKGDGRNTSASFATPKDNDIHNIKQGQAEQRIGNDYFFDSTAYWISLLIPLITFITLLILFRKRAIDNADVVKKRGKHANKMATKRLKTARQLLSKGKSDEFYDEVLRALWEYVSYKLNIPVEQLSRENIKEQLLSRQVDGNTINLFLSALDECEFERYAPGDASGNMEKTLRSAMTAITEIENAMKRRK